MVDLKITQEVQTDLRMFYYQNSAMFIGEKNVYIAVKMLEYNTQFLIHLRTFIFFLFNLHRKDRRGQIQE